MSNYVHALLEDTNLVTLWHGGSASLSSEFRDISGAKGKWEYGPGLYASPDMRYVIDHYARGSRRLWKIEAELDSAYNDVSVQLPLNDCVDFLRVYVGSAKRKELQSLLEYYAHSGNVQAMIFLNVVASDTVQRRYTPQLRRFLIDHKVKYRAVDIYGTTFYVIFDPSVIVSAKVISRSSV